MKVGQVVFLRPIKYGNAFRRDQSIREATIEKIGRKYVTISEYGQFYIEDGSKKTNYTTEYKLYFSKDELDSIIESESLTEKIRSSIPKYGKWNLGIEKLRQIADIINCR